MVESVSWCVSLSIITLHLLTYLRAFVSTRFECACVFVFRRAHSFADLCALFGPRDDPEVGVVAFDGEISGGDVARSVCNFASSCGLERLLRNFVLMGPFLCRCFFFSGF